MSDEKTSVDWRLKSATIPALVLRQPRESLDTSERMMIGILAMFGEVAFPGRELLADLIGCSIATVTRTSENLQEKGWLEVTLRNRGDGTRTSNRYSLKVPEGAQREYDKAIAQIAPRTVAQIATAVGADCAHIKESEVLREKGKEEITAEGAGPPPAPPGTGKA